MAHQTRIHYKQIDFQQTFHDISNTSKLAGSAWSGLRHSAPDCTSVSFEQCPSIDAKSISTFVHSQSLAQPTGWTQELVSLSMNIPLGHSQLFTIQTAGHGMGVLALAQVCWQVLSDAHSILL